MRPPAPSNTAPNSSGASRLAGRWRVWWRRQAPHRQDRFAALAPLVAVVLFLAAIASSFLYLRLEEMDREQEAVKRDVEYAQQQIRLRLLERQEQLMRVARDAGNEEIDVEEFVSRSQSLIAQYPELQAVTWIDERRRIKTSYATPSLHTPLMRLVDDVLLPGETETNFSLARDLHQPVYGQPLGSNDATPLLQLHIPLTDRGRFSGVVLAEYAPDGLLRHGVPAEVLNKYAVALLAANGRVLAGNAVPQAPAGTRLLPWSSQAEYYEVPVSPVGNGLMLRAQAYRTSQGLVGTGLFWLVGALSVLTAWMLIGNWSHTRRRQQAQQALIAETNFRRAMENSMLTGMRALDMQGRITYVNAAFCQMTGWSENELVGRTAPFPYWPEEDLEFLIARLEDELNGRSTPSGFQVRVKRRDGSLFDARLYVSPLIDAVGKQTGWMTSMTDITEPNRIREQLSASYERFTTVLEALDAAVSVAPLGSPELLFANKLYRLWFGAQTRGHEMLVARAGMPPTPAVEEGLDDVDAFAGLPTDSLTTGETESAEIHAPELGKWLEVRARYLSWVDGRLVQMVIATDITPRRLAEEQAATQAERAQTSSRLITMGEMASSVAHELNQPLAAISNYCSGMVSRLRGNGIAHDDLLAALEKTARQAQRAGQIIHRIQSFVKRSEPNRTVSNVQDIVHESVELAGIELRRRNVRLSHYVAARLPPLIVDPILIEQVLINLLRNAAEAIDSAQRPLQRRNIELRVLPKQVEDAPGIEFAVTDTGTGLAPEVMEHLFEAFFSTKAHGMGIGLNLCRSIVESHLGRMQAENIYNGPECMGCRFSFWIPLAKAANTLPNPANTSKSTGVPA
ncbi:PAS domain-containing sensor histidine kinase [Pseudorhodoferax sp. Leaf267]|uniref:PAS domain-containing sensor histidine kinase n=1 Tax=Pseudorhodoferax sp. Leaf267 TaxID=1736316 RepID=UPI000B18D317|nr:PAS domain-containing sensor histidine kinase [Pseudorhodoferax sp. Leaf267]